MLGARLLATLFLIFTCVVPGVVTVSAQESAPVSVPPLTIEALPDSERPPKEEAIFAVAPFELGRAYGLARSSMLVLPPIDIDPKLYEDTERTGIGRSVEGLVPASPDLVDEKESELGVVTQIWQQAVVSPRALVH